MAGKYHGLRIFGTSDTSIYFQYLTGIITVL
jgi:hypothetical protein